MTLFIVAGSIVAVALAWWVSQLGSRSPGDARRIGSARSAPSAPPTEAEIQSLIAGGDMIEAIKRYREMTGLGLKESKDAIDALAAGRAVPSARSAPPTVPRLDPATDPEIRRLVAAGELIEAIKRYRVLTGAGLKEAKDAIDGMPR